MKNGCFISVIVLLTIVIGIGLYLYRNKRDFLKEFEKEKVLLLISSQIESRLNKLQKNIYKDSLRVLIKKEFQLTKKEKFSKVIDQIDDFAKSINTYARDLKLDSLEFAKLKFMVIQHEGSKKN
jgi:hypothetical protein